MTNSTLEVDALVKQYEGMAEDFKTKGLNTQAIAGLKPWFFGLDPMDTIAPRPRKYHEFEEPLGPNVVRLLLIPLSESADIVHKLGEVTNSIMELIPPTHKVFRNKSDNYHCTVFHTSHPMDVRTDPHKPDGGVDADQPSHLRPVSTAEQLAVELATVAGLVQVTTAPQLLLERVLMASSGTLLATWVDPSGHVTDLRRRMRSALPGSCTKQATIIHTSLCRIVSPDLLHEDAISRIAAACEEWTAQLRGSSYMPTKLAFVFEDEFSTVEGHWNYLELHHEQ